MVIIDTLTKVLADTCWFDACVPGTSSTLTTADGVWSKVVEFANFIFVGVAVLCVVLIIYGGLQFITSAGDSDRVESGTATIKNAIIGLVIVFISGLIINAVFRIVATGSLE